MTFDPEYRVFVDEKGEKYAERIDGVEVCDFCMAPWPDWEYPARDFPIVGHPVMTDSTGAWGACTACMLLIEAEDIVGLVHWSLAQQLVHQPPSREIVYPPESVRRLFQHTNVSRFLKARTGPAVRYVRPPSA